MSKGIDKKQYKMSYTRTPRSSREKMNYSFIKEI